LIVIILCPTAAKQLAYNKRALEQVVHGATPAGIKAYIDKLPPEDKKNFHFMEKTADHGFATFIMVACHHDALVCNLKSTSDSVVAVTHCHCLGCSCGRCRVRRG
jgi:hypothetical protein